MYGPPRAAVPQHLSGTAPTCAGSCGATWACPSRPQTRSWPRARVFGTPLLDGIPHEAVPRLPDRLRRAHPGAAVVLAGRFLPGDHRRGHRRPRAGRQGVADDALDHAPLPIDGAADGSVEDTAFACRDGGWAGVIAGVNPDPANRADDTAWTKDYWDALHPPSAGGAYVNFMMDEGDDRIHAAYRDNYERLAQVDGATIRITCSGSTRTSLRRRANPNLTR